MRKLPLRLRASCNSRLPPRPTAADRPCTVVRPGPWPPTRGSGTGQRHQHSIAYSHGPAVRTFAATTRPAAIAPKANPAADSANPVEPAEPVGAAAAAADPAAHHRPAQRCGGSVQHPPLPRLPFRFDTGVAFFAKRTPRPFPPPFHSPPSLSFSDALSTHDRSRDRRAYVDGHLIGGCTNGDDAAYAGTYFIAANDGVGAWSMRPRGHAGLWARLIVHFWATAVNNAVAEAGAFVPGAAVPVPDPVRYLQQAYEQTIEATRAPNDWQGTTTAAGAQLWYRPIATSAGAGAGAGADAGAGAGASSAQTPRPTTEPVLYVTNLGDSQVMVVRPAEGRLLFKTKPQWHWFDCPRQLGTNSPDTPRTSAVIDVVPLHVGDVVLAMTDGVVDNLWTHEIVENVSKSVAAWQGKTDKTAAERDRGMMTTVAEELVEAARVVAVDPFAESPFMEHAIEEGLAGEGGKLDDISVVAAICRRNDVT
ncbi:Protein phosphatase 2C-like protein [Niveomyces insectorum RCEF 264]|uniref:Protein phosphatase n=1 Tax=Niveomyces insectorum RCEF 264 TaxID=1081102 RepID=A0A167PE07_9HYPO|nr:Protein phosphatase 2C-like protein [Niveomyces insectorum RCEF 264]